MSKPSQAEFVAKFGDEISGLLLQSFVDAENVSRSASVTYSFADTAARGQRMISQLKRARSLLERMYQSMNGNGNGGGNGQS